MDIVDAYHRGAQTMGNVRDWYQDQRQQTPDIYAPQDWTAVNMGRGRG